MEGGGVPSRTTRRCRREEDGMEVSTRMWRNTAVASGGAVTADSGQWRAAIGEAGESGDR
jgi:hypothetical protein